MDAPIADEPEPAPHVEDQPESNLQVVEVTAAINSGVSETRAVEGANSPEAKSGPTQSASSSTIKRQEWRSSLTVAVAVSGWLAALAMGVLDLPEKINKFYKELPETEENIGIWPPIDKRFSGAWKMAPKCEDEIPNLPDISGTNDNPINHGLDFTLEFNARDVQGEIMTDRLGDEFLSPEVQMLGRTNGSKAKMRIADWMGGKPTTLGWANIQRIGDNCLSFDILEDAAGLFPKHAVMIRQSLEDYEQIPRKFGMAERAAKEALAKVKKEQGAVKK